MRAAVWALTAIVGVGAVAAEDLNARSPERIAAARAWFGPYGYTEMVPRSGDITGVIEYELKLSDDGCRLKAEGVMTNADIRCTAAMRGNALVIGFKSYANGSVKNQYDVAQYQPGQALLTLRRTPIGLVTNWQAYTRSDGKAEAGRYFKKKP